MSSEKVHSYHVAKVIEVVAGPDKGFDYEVNVAITGASRTLREISGLEVEGFNVKLVGDKPVEYPI